MDLAIGLSLDFVIGRTCKEVALAFAFKHRSRTRQSSGFRLKPDTWIPATPATLVLRHGSGRMPKLLWHRVVDGGEFDFQNDLFAFTIDFDFLDRTD